LEKILVLRNQLLLGHNVVPSVTPYREEGTAGYHRVFVAERSDKEEGRE